MLLTLEINIISYNNVINIVNYVIKIKWTGLTILGKYGLIVFTNCKELCKPY